MLITENENNYFTLKKEDKSKNNPSTKETQKTEQVQQIEISNTDMELLEKVKEYIKDKETISVSRIQCEFTVGYPKGHKIMQLLIQEGLVEQVEKFRYIVKK